MIKYGELTTKKGNRNTFINLLENNIKKITDAKIIKDRVRMYIEYKDDTTIEKLKNVFGIHAIVLAYKLETPDENMIIDLIKDIKFKTFKVNTKRADKRFPIKSMDFNNKIGGAVLRNYDCKVDVHNPDLMINIEIREKYTYIYFNEEKGLGGYPVGVQGKGLLMLSGGIDSPVAGYLTMKRGVNLDCVYFDSPPHTSEQAKNKVIKLAQTLNNYSGNVRLLVVPFTKLQEAIHKNVPSNYNITIMRRMMYRICEGLAKKNKCKIIINGESIGQVASQTLSSMQVINAVTNFPVIRPVSCLDKLEIIDIANKIKTYETSILPYEDCCTIFVPKHPVINPKIEDCIKYEQFEYEELLTECIDNTRPESLEIKTNSYL